MVLTVFALLFGIIVTLIIVLGVFLILKLNQKIKRVTETDVTKIPNGYFHRSFMVNGQLDQTTKTKLLIYLDKYKGKVVAANKQDIISYINGLRFSFLHGPNIPWDKIPLRIIFTEENQKINVRLDESRGIKKINPSVADIYDLKYKQAFDFHSSQIKTILDSIEI